MTALLYAAWMDRRDLPCQRDPQLWTSTEESERDEAAELCGALRCPVLATCRQWAVEHDLHEGAWGGVNFNRTVERNAAARAVTGQPARRVRDRRLYAAAGGPS